MKKPHAMIGLLAALGTAIGVLVAVVGLPYGRANYTAFAGLYHAGDTNNPVLAGHLQVDCDTATPGLQDACTVTNTAGTLVVDAVFADNSASSSIGALKVTIRNPDTARLNAPSVPDGLGFNGNPDFNEAGPGAAGAWNCSLVPHSNDNPAAVGHTGPPSQMSELSCFAPGTGPAYIVASDVTLADVTYNKVVGATGVSVLSFGDSLVGDNGGIELINCYGVDGIPGNVDDQQCFPATITMVNPPTPLPPTITPVPPTATNTPVPPTATATPAGATLNKIPEGNANNVDLAIPAANLWICVTGPCSGPGEGNLIVFEYATNVNTGDFNGDTVVDGLGAYEFVVEYDNFVIASVNPSDVVFNPGPIAPYPTGADLVVDGEGAARAPATCSFSITTENYVRFGCVTSGFLPAGPIGNMDIARLNLIPHEDLRSDLIPGNDNGVVTNIKDNNCELADVFGHPVTGSVGGGLLPVCGNLAVTVRMLEGDLNLDCTVDVTDQQAIAFRYGSEFGSLLYNRFFDLEPALQDLDIDIKDLQKVFGRDGSTCQIPIQPQPPLGPAVPF